jgi:hypothetical protein
MTNMCPRSAGVSAGAAAGAAGAGAGWLAGGALQAEIAKAIGTLAESTTTRYGKRMKLS